MPSGSDNPTKAEKRRNTAAPPGYGRNDGQPTRRNTAANRMAAPPSEAQMPEQPAVENQTTSRTAADIRQEVR
jgi:hypothetical protein